MTVRTKMLMVAALLTVSFGTTVLATPTDQLIVAEFVRTYDLDTSWYDIEVVSNGLSDEDAEPSEIKLRSLSDKEPSGMFLLAVKVERNGKVVDAGQARLNIRRYGNVVVAADKIRRHQLLDESCLTIKRMEITRLTERAIASLDELNAFRARRAVRKGAILTTGAVEPYPDIESGREISLVYQDGLCRISATGVALQTGMAGDYIRVKNKGSGKIVIARIIDASAVVIDP